ncbi:unnamed protein product [Brassica oleracea]|uniref:(rape) hypothetical protein n=1 Tax=Brassica napus TaxID=3708 RepID=A0A816KU39_BRANA|nr:unnamed protein product [Brassica napus]
MLFSYVTFVGKDGLNRLSVSQRCFFLPSICACFISKSYDHKLQLFCFKSQTDRISVCIHLRFFCEFYLLFLCSQYMDR